MLILVSLNYTACSPDNSEDEPAPSIPIVTPEDNLPEASKAFVGYWESYNYFYNFLFFGDGVCWKFTTNSGHGIEERQKGYWSFSPVTSILATTTNDKQWTITLSNDQAWTGISINTKKTDTFSHPTELEYIRAILYRSKWIDENDEYMSFGSSELENGGLIESMHVCYCDITNTNMLNTVNILSLSEDDNLNDYTFNYEMISKTETEGWEGHYSTHVKGKGTITLLNPTSSTQQKLIFKGWFENTLSRYW